LKKAVINGRCIERYVNGIPRYIAEIVKNLDLVRKNGIEIELVIPKGKELGFELKNIRVTELADAPAWDYTKAERYAKKQNALYINPASKGVWYRNSVTTFHDIRPLTFGDEKLSLNSLKSKSKFGISFFLGIRRCKALVTVSKSAKNEIISYSGLRHKKIYVIGNGWEHITGTDKDDSVFSEFSSIRKGDYYFAVSSIAPHKNFGWIIRNAALHPEQQFVIVGKTNPSLWTDDTSDFKGNIIYLGYQSDSRVRTLLENSKALVFPTKYEGFGIPPLEAAALKVPAIVSDIDVMHEIYGDIVHYIDPDDPNTDLDELLKEKLQPSDEILKKYSWRISALKWLKLIDMMCE